MIAFLQLTRPVFLLGGAVFFAVGAAAAAGPVDWGRYALGQALVTAVQLATQYANEHFDLEADRAGRNRTWLSGGSGVLATGRLEPGVAVRAASVSTAIALALGAVLVAIEPVVAMVGVVALYAGWYYSAPPVRLVGSGLGELAASFVVAVLTPLTGALMQQPGVPTALWRTMGVLVLAHLAMLMALHLPDIDGDAAVGKRTLAVRIGASWTRVAIVALLAMTATAAAAVGEWGAVLGLPTGAVVTFVVVARPGAYPLLTTSAVATTAALGLGYLI